MAAFQYLESTVFIQYKRKVELCQSQQYVPLSSFVFSIEEVIDLAGGNQHKFSLLSKQECYELIHLAKQYKLISYIHEDNDYHVFVPGALKKIYKRMEMLFSS